MLDSAWFRFVIKNSPTGSDPRHNRPRTANQCLGSEEKPEPCSSAGRQHQCLGGLSLPNPFLFSPAIGTIGFCRQRRSRQGTSVARLDTWMWCHSSEGVEKSLDAARKSAYATSRLNEGSAKGAKRFVLRGVNEGSAKAAQRSVLRGVNE